MADLIKKIKIKKEDGTFTDYIPIGADATNVVTLDGESVQLKLNKKLYYYTNVASMKADAKLKVNDMVITFGYYEANDGGGAEYQIIDNNELVDDGGSIHDLDNGLKAKLIIKNEINVKQFGAKGNNVTNDATAFNKAFNYNVSQIIIPQGTYLLSNIVYLNSKSNMTIENYGLINRSSSATNDTPCFQIADCNNITLNGFNISSERNQTGFAPSEHTRVTEYSSNIAGIKILKCDNIYINNSKFTNMEYDIRITKRPTDTERTILSHNIYINNIYSRNSSQSIYAQNVKNLFIEKADIIPVENLGDGDHFLYVSEYSENIKIKDSILISPDKYFGVGFNIAEAHYNEDVASPQNFEAENIKMICQALLNSKGTTISKLNNIDFTMIRNENDNNQRAIGLGRSAKTYMINSNIITEKYFINTEATNGYISVVNTKIIGNGAALLMSISKNTTNILLNNCTIENGNAIIYIYAAATGCNVELNNCILKNSGETYTVSQRNTSYTNKIIFRNCITINTQASPQAVFMYNGSGVNGTGLELYSSYISNYSALMGATTGIIAINSYLNNTLITI